MNRCNETQETIAAGTPLSPEDQRHAADCARCAAVAASYSLLDATLAAFGPQVPDAFADRVMALVADEDAPGRIARWYERWPIQMAVANAAALCAALNVVYFVVRVFVADVALGAAR
jgi:hypothetical protein